ncbi:unnamed protein product [Ceratitis capitata]|uniref:(Mediterranean fruit fly) hypothetical protein n=1 Tax=Ceratitis capitata TaxID=7213 RepID=A0A811UAP4_CERCA|nr:unnamed protein product [Ceratitis capitata]
MVMNPDIGLEFLTVPTKKLSSDNYTTWCIQIKCLLITLDFWNAVLVKSPETEPEKSAWTTYDENSVVMRNYNKVIMTGNLENGVYVENAVSDANDLDVSIIFT